MEQLLRIFYKLKRDTVSRLLIKLPLSACKFIDLSKHSSYSKTSRFPAPIVPRFDIMKLIFADCLVLAVLTYCQAISQALLYAKIHSYKINTQQVCTKLCVCRNIVVKNLCLRAKIHLRFAFFYYPICVKKSRIISFFPSQSSLFGFVGVERNQRKIFNSILFTDINNICQVYVLKTG